MIEDRGVVEDRGVSDSAARARAVAAVGSVLVQAPAGSGKTTLLVQRYLRLLTRVDAPERILALTFTRSAALEMRARVLQALRAGDLAHCPAAMNADTWALAVQAKRHLLALNLDVVQQPSRLRIQTIDAFNAWLAGRLPIAAGLGAAVEVLNDAKFCYQEAARRALAHDVDDQFGAAVDRVLALDDLRLQKLVRLLGELLLSRERWLPLLAGHLQVTGALDEAQLVRLRGHFDEDLRLLVLRTLLRATEVLGTGAIDALSPLVHRAAGRMEAGRTMLNSWTESAAPLRADVLDLARWRSVAALLLTGQGGYRKRLTKNEGFPPKCADTPAMMVLLQEFGNDPLVRKVLREVGALPEPAYGDEQWARVREVAQMLVLVAAQLDQVFREQGAVDFAAVSLAARRALGTEAQPTDLALQLDYRLQHILVDEFQDTSSAQLELLRLMTAGWQSGDGRSLFCVGDPMQSIYGFRQAEVRAFLELAEEGIGDLRFQVERLRENFRSAAAIVDWINSCFATLLPRVDDRNRGAIAFRPSRSAVDDSAQAVCTVGMRGFTSASRESMAIAELIAARLGTYPKWRIAILVRARSHARDIAAALRSRGIAFRAVGIVPIKDIDVVRDIISLLCAMLHLGDRTAWLAVLRAPWAGITLADLLLISRGSPVVWPALSDESVMAQLSDDGQARCRRLRATLETAFRVRNDSSVVRWIERTWLCLGGPACAHSAQDLQYASTAFARLRELELRGLPDSADLTASFADLYADHGAAGSVEIMTIHKAKGLEFDMVVLPALERSVAQGRDQLFLSHQFARTGRDGMVMAARPAVGAGDDPLYEFLRHQQRDAAMLEAQRLLYVACTRAKWQLWLTASVGTPAQPRALADDFSASNVTSNKSAPQRPWAPRSGSLLALLWPAAAAQFAVSSDASAPAPAAQSSRGGPLLRVPAQWSPPVDRAPKSAQPMFTLPAQRLETPIFDWVGETARRVGTLIHAQLQAMDLVSTAESAIRAKQGQFRRWLAVHGVPAQRLDEAAARVVAALIAVQQDPRGRWILQRAREDARELALSGLVRGELVHVVIDRSFIDEHNVRWIIDYKTSQHLGGEVVEFLDREVDRYRPQLERYATLVQRLGPQPVKLGLYFPLLRAWREWDP